MSVWLEPYDNMWNTFRSSLCIDQFPCLLWLTRRLVVNTFSWVWVKYRKMYSSTNVLQYKCTPVQMYSSTNVLQYKCTPVQMYSSTNVLQYKCTPVHMYSSTNVLQYKCTPVQMYSISKVRYYKSAMHAQQYAHSLTTACRHRLFSKLKDSTSFFPLVTIVMKLQSRQAVLHFQITYT